MADIKLGVYTICKNELQFVDKWMECMLEADHIAVLDTGSTDGCYERLLEWQDRYPGKIIINQKTYSPWRFDIPRDDNLDMIIDLDDIFISIDLDELMGPAGWVRKIKDAWRPGVSRMSYKYTWSFDDDGNPGRVFWYNKIHDRTWHWIYPVHECLVRRDNGSPDYTWAESAQVEDIMLEHHPDKTKSRGSYLPLLELRKKEYPSDAMGRIYLANEYVYRGMYEKALDEFTEILNTFDYGPIEKAACRRFMAECDIRLDRTVEAIENYHRSIEADPMYREAYIGLGNLYLSLKLYDMARGTLEQGLKNGVRRYSWHELDTSWSYGPYDSLCQAYYWSGDYDKSVINAEKALSYKPDDERLKKNLELCLKKV